MKTFIQMSIAELKSDILRLVVETESKTLLQKVIQYFELLRKQGSGDQLPEDKNASVSKMEMMKQAASDPLFLADLQEVTVDFAPIDHESL